LTGSGRGTIVWRRCGLATPENFLTWILASLGFSFYAAQFGNYGATYGSLGGIVILLFYFFISAAVLLFGAEINATILPASEKQAGDGAALRTT
jgi:uncharacterized BrkB/YihY/UPF0761 family membrane protein